MMPRRTYVWSALALATLLFFGVNIFANNFFTDTRLDLTQSGQYTLSDGTRAVIAKLPEPVTLRFYFSKKNAAQYPVTAAYAKRVRDLLGTYASLSRGKIVLEDVAPEAFTPEEDMANAAGIRAAATPTGESVYFGLEGSNSIDGKQVIPYFAVEREPYLEYDLTSLVYQLSHPEKRKLAILSSLPLAGTPEAQGQPLATYAQLQRDYAVTMLAPDFLTIPPVDVLLIAHPQNVSEAQIQQIRSYTARGGKAVIFLDPLSELARQSAPQGTPPFSDLAPLLKDWGVSYTPQMVVLDRALAQRVQAGPESRQASVSFPLWIHLTAENFAPRDPVTANLQGLNLASVGSLSPAAGARTHFEPLISSSTQASLFAGRLVMAMRDPGELMSQVKPTGKPFTIAARITGANLNVVLVADSDVFDDRFWLRPGSPPQAFADNANLILNAVENLSGSNDLSSLRTRGPTDRPFTRVRAMQAQADLKFRETLDGLEAKLTAAQQEIAQLQQGGRGGNATSLSPEQQARIDAARREIAVTRIQLRDTQRQLSGDIDRLGTFLAFLNILAMPLLVAAFAIVFGVMRRGRARHAPLRKVEAS